MNSSANLARSSHIILANFGMSGDHLTALEGAATRTRRLLSRSDAAAAMRGAALLRRAVLPMGVEDGLEIGCQLLQSALEVLKGFAVEGDALAVCG
jgi:hypothetical protein